LGFGDARSVGSEVNSSPDPLGALVGALEAATPAQSRASGGGGGNYGFGGGGNLSSMGGGQGIGTGGGLGLRGTF